MHLPQLPSVGKESLPVTMSVKETIKWFKIQMSGGWEGLEWVKRGGFFTWMEKERERDFKNGTRKWQLGVVWTEIVSWRHYFMSSTHYFRGCIPTLLLVMVGHPCHLKHKSMSRIYDFNLQFSSLFIISQSFKISFRNTVIWYVCMYIYISESSDF